MPVVHTDMFLVPGQEKPQVGNWLHYRLPELKAIISSRLDREKPVIVEGVCLLHTLEEIGLPADYHIVVEQDGHDGGLVFESMRKKYSEQYSPLMRAHHIFKWSPHDLEV